MERCIFFFMGSTEKNGESVPKTLEDKLANKFEFAWDHFSDTDRTEIYTLAEDYLEFLRNARTERERTIWAVNRAKAAGFTQLEFGQNMSSLKPGDKVFYVNRNKNVALIVIGTTPMTEKLHLIGAHIDTPRLDAPII